MGKVEGDYLSDLGLVKIRSRLAVPLKDRQQLLVLKWFEIKLTLEKNRNLPLLLQGHIYILSAGDMILKIGKFRLLKAFSGQMACSKKFYF